MSGKITAKVARLYLKDYTKETIINSKHIFKIRSLKINNGFVMEP